MGVGNSKEKTKTKREGVNTTKKGNNFEREEREFVRAKVCHWVAWQGITHSRKH